MNKKKLSHSNLNSSITSVLAALLCIVIGMACLLYTSDAADE